MENALVEQTDGEEFIRQMIENQYSSSSFRESQENSDNDLPSDPQSSVGAYRSMRESPSPTKRSRTLVLGHHRASSQGPTQAEDSVLPTPSEDCTLNRIKADALKWASTFEGPQNEDEVGLGYRRAASSSRPPEDTPKKRKSDESWNLNVKSKRSRGPYSNNYRLLLNGYIHDTIAPRDDEGPALVESQIGVSKWSSLEKELFFRGIARLGKDNVREIAARIGTKSETEVQEYKQLLHEEILAKISGSQQYQALILADIPAAIQISPECCEILEKSGDELAIHQERHEEKVERTKWGETWLLTLDVNNRLEADLAEDNDNHEIQDILPAVDLLNLGKWLEVSTRVFMNPAPPMEDGNWQYLIEPGEDHGIRATAFQDFHRLAISVTKRLVSATIFCAMSRLRAGDSYHLPYSDLVRAADVKAAVKTLGLELNSRKFWRNSARRCHLDVYENPLNKDDVQQPMSYDEVEASFDSADAMGRRLARRETPMAVDELSIYEGSSDDNGFKTDPDLERHRVQAEYTATESHTRDLASEYTSNGHLYGALVVSSESEFGSSGVWTQRSVNKALTRKALEHDHTRYAEAFDLKASLKEEQRIWALMDQEPPFTIRPEMFELPKLPAPLKKEVEDVVDWRDRTDFWSHWEMLEKPIPKRAFDDNAKLKRQRKKIFTSVDDSDSDMLEKPVDPKDGLEDVDDLQDEQQVTHDEADSENSDVVDSLGALDDTGRVYEFQTLASPVGATDNNKS